MNISVLKPSEVLGILVHGDFWSIEDGGLIHIVPYVQVKGGASVLTQGEVIGPPLTHFRVDKIRPCG